MSHFQSATFQRDTSMQQSEPFGTSRVANEQQLLIDELQRENQCYLQEIMLLSDQLEKQKEREVTQYQESYWKQEYLAQKDKMQEMAEQITNYELLEVALRQYDEQKFQQEEIFASQLRARDDEINQLTHKVAELEWLNEQNIEQLRQRDQRSNTAMQEEDSNRSKEELSASRNKLQQLIHENNTLKYREISQQNSHEAYKIEIEHKIHSLQIEKDELEQKLEDLGSREPVTSQIIDEQQTQIKRLEELLSSSKSTISQLEELVQTTQANSLTQHSDIERLRQQVESLEKALFRASQNPGSRNEAGGDNVGRVQLDQEKREHKQTLLTLQQVSKDLKQAEEELSKAQTREDQAELELKRLRLRNSDLQRANDQLSMKSQKDGYVSVGRQRELETQNITVIAEMKSLEKENQKLNDLLTKQRRTLRQKVEEMRTQLKKVLKSIFASLQLERESLKIKTREDLAAIKKDQIAMFMAIVRDQRELNATAIQAQNNKLAREWSEKTDVLRNQLQAHFLKSKEKIEQRYNQSLQETKNGYETQLSEQNKKQREIEQELQLSREDIHQQKELVKDLKQSLNQTIDQYEGHITQLKCDLNRKDDLIHSTQQRTLEYKEETLRSQMQKEQIETLTNDNRYLKTQLDDKEQQLRKAKLDLATQGETLRVETSMSKELTYIQRIRALEDEKQDMQVQLQQLQQSQREQSKYTDLLLQDTKTKSIEMDQRFQDEYHYMKELMINEIQAQKNKNKELEIASHSLELENEKLKRKVSELEAKLIIYDKPMRLPPAEQPLTAVLTPMNESQLSKRDFQTKEMNMIVAKYKYERYQSDSLQSLEEKHNQRLKAIKSGSSIVQSNY